MILSITPKLLALCFLLTLNTSADNSDNSDSALAQKDPLNFSPSLSDDGFGLIGNQPVIQNGASLQQLSDRLIETPKPPPLTGSDSFDCASSPHTRKMLRRSWRRPSKRQQDDFCSVHDHEKLKPASPSEPGADDIPAGQQGKAGIGRPRDSMGGANEYVPDPVQDLDYSQLFGNPNPSLCPNADRRVPMCSPYDQKLSSPTLFLVPSRFWQPNDWCSDMEGTWEDLWCCAFAYIHPSAGWQLRAVFKRYPSTGIQCMLLRNHYTGN